MNEDAFSQRVLGSLSAVTQLADEVQRGQHYVTAVFPKKDGSERVLQRPDPILKDVLKKANELFSRLPIQFPDHVYGFVRGRSIVDNARNHLAKAAVARFDIHHFFDSITGEQVVQALESFGFTRTATELITRLTIITGTLPTGFPTSPFLSNLVFLDADAELSRLARARNLKFTRFVDDLIFSGQIDSSLFDDVPRILEKHGWYLNERKTLLMKRGGKQYVTGLSVSDPSGPRIPVALKRRLRLKLHYIQKLGYESYMENCKGDALNDHPRRLLGLARYVASVEPKLGRNLLGEFHSAFDDSWYGPTSDDEIVAWLEDLR